MTTLPTSNGLSRRTLLGTTAAASGVLALPMTAPVHQAHADVGTQSTPGDVSNVTDQTFFGVWDGGAGQWSTVPQLDYAISGLALVAAAAKVSNYDLASTELLSYSRSRADRIAPRAITQTNGRDYTSRLPLIMDHVWTRSGDVHLGTLEVPLTAAALTIDVTVSARPAANSGFLAIMLLCRYKSTGTAKFASRTATSGTPRLLVELENGATLSLAASNDTYIKPGPDAGQVFGTESEILVHEEGIGPFTDLTARGYLSFPLTNLESPISSAQLELTGHAIDTTEPLVVSVYQTNISFDETTRTWANTLLETLSWQGDPGGYDWLPPAGTSSDFTAWLCRFLWSTAIIDEYSRTGNEEYAQAQLGLMTDFITDADTYAPEYGAGEYNHFLHAGIRLANWIFCYETLRKSPSLTPGLNTAILKTMVKSGEFIDTVDPGTSAQNQIMYAKVGLLNLGVCLPELARAATWETNATTFLSNQISEVVRADGGYAEASYVYARGYVFSFREIIDFLASYGRTFPGSTDLNRLATFIAHQLYPDGWGPAYGDGATSDERAQLLDIAESLVHPVLEHAATLGGGGTPPARASVYFPDTKVVVQRTGWTPDSLYLRMNQDMGSHSHSDDLSVLVYAYGRPLLPSMGTYGYSTSPVDLWFRYSTNATNTVTVDGKSQTFSANGGFTNAWFGNSFENADAHTFASAGVRHSRTAFFVAQRFWIITDQLDPNVTGSTHTYDACWHYLPNAAPATDPLTLQTRTHFSTGANISVIPLGATDVSMRNGYYVENGIIVDNPFLVHRRILAGRSVWQTVLYPRAAGTNDTVVTEVLAADAGVSAFTMTVSGAEPTSTIYLRRPEPGTTTTAGDLTTDGRSAAVHVDGTVVRAYLQDGTTVTRAGVTLLQTAEPVANIEAELSTRHGTVAVRVAEGANPRMITVAAPWARNVTVNGHRCEFVRSGRTVSVSPASF